MVLVVAVRGISGNLNVLSVRERYAVILADVLNDMAHGVFVFSKPCGLAVTNRFIRTANGCAICKSVYSGAAKGGTF